MVFSLFEYLDSVNRNHRKYVQLWQLFDKKKLELFIKKRLKEKKGYLVGMKFCCASNAAIRNAKIVRKVINFFPKIFLRKSPFLK